MEKKGIAYLEKKDNVYYLCLNNPKANNFSTDFIRQINAQLDIVEKDENICALVTTSKLERFFSTGLDIKFISNMKHPEDLKNFLLEFSQLLGRILVFPVPTIAFIHGPAMAGGFMLCMAHDYRFMVEEKSWVCLNEVDMGLPLLPAMNAVVQCKVTPDAFRELFLTGKRINAADSLKLKIVDYVYEKSKILEEVHNFANTIAEKSAYKDNFKALKMEAYQTAYQACTDRKFGIHTGAVKTLMSLGKL